MRARGKKTQQSVQAPKNTSSYKSSEFKTYQRFTYNFRQRDVVLKHKQKHTHRQTHKHLLWPIVVWGNTEEVETQLSKDSNVLAGINLYK